MKLLILLGLAAFMLAGCGQGGGSGGEEMSKFLSVPKTTFAGGASMPNGDYAKYEIVSDGTKLVAQLELRKNGRCVKSTGELAIKDIGGTDRDGQAYDLGTMKVQIEPKNRRHVDHNDLFVHLIATKPAPSDCTQAPATKIDEQDYASHVGHHFLSDFGLTPKQLSVATQAELHGSKTYMLYFSGQNLGLAFSSRSGELVGIDIPKNKLLSDYTFTVNRRFLSTDKLASDELFPLLLDQEDQKALARTESLVAAMKSVDPSAQSAEKTQELRVYVWFQQFTN